MLLILDFFLCIILTIDFRWKCKNYCIFAPIFRFYYLTVILAGNMLLIIGYHKSILYLSWNCKYDNIIIWKEIRDLCSLWDDDDVGDLAPKPLWQYLFILRLEMFNMCTCSCAVFYSFHFTTFLFQFS